VKPDARWHPASRMCGGVYHQARWFEFCVSVAIWLVLMEFMFFPFRSLPPVVFGG